MKGDFSRSTFRPENHYRAVRLQQGRVLLDAEWNEQADIAAHVERTATADLVGPTGAPKHPPAAHAHFAVRLASGGSDLELGPGRFYVDGILCESAGTTYLDQPDLPGAPLPAGPGPQAVFLDVWERHVTPVEQDGSGHPPLRETALGGPDTATRSQVVWQARLAPLETKTCAAFVPPAPSAGRLRARAVPAPDPGDDCLVPETGGYRRLENQLYRVEVEATPASGPVVTWSRDNGSVVSRVLDVDATALVIVVEDEDRDDTHGFATARFVELSDEERWRRNERGVVLEVQSVTGTAVTVANPDSLSLAVGTNPTLRRWDGRLALTAGTPAELEDGVEVEIDGGALAPADYWVVPARTLSGTVEWATDGADPPAPAFEAPHGVDHHYAVLATVDFDGTTFAAPVDCRPQFPPLTAVAASDVSYDPEACANLAGATTVQEALDRLCAGAGGGGDHCVVLGPTDDLVARFEALSGLDSAVVCLTAGEWRVDRAAVVRKTGSVIVAGTGPSTRILAPGGAALAFESCGAVQVRDLAVATRVGPPEGAPSGALDVTGARVVLVERVEAQVGGGPASRTAGIAVGSRATNQPGPAGTEWVVVRDCQVRVGDHQSGILVAGSARTEVTGNLVVGVREGNVTGRTLAQFLRDADFARAVARRAVAPGTKDQLGARQAFARHLDLGPVQFATEVDDPAGWRALAAGMADAQKLQDRVHDDLMRANPDSPFFRPDTAFSRWLATVGADLQAGAQGGRGIAVAAPAAGDVRIAGNSLAGLIEGITVAGGAAGRARELAGRVEVRGNSVATLRRAARAFLEPAIGVAHCDSLWVGANRVAPAAAGEQRFAIEGVLVEGRLGPYADVSANLLDGTAVGIRVATGPGADQLHLRVARDNLATAGPVLVDPSNTFRDEGNVGT